VQLLFLVESSVSGGCHQERELIARHPERFRCVLADDGVWIWAVLPGSSSGSSASVDLPGT